jgi:RHS repeat-associated protein
VEVNGVRKEAEGGEAEYDQGAYTAGCFDGVNVSPGQEQLEETGALRFGFSGVVALDRTISYDNGTIVVFDYDAHGNRVKKCKNGVLTYYFFSNYKEMVADHETTVVKYYYGPNGQIAQRTVSGEDEELLYVHTDPLGSAVRMTNTDGDPVQSIAYDPYGRTVFSSGSENPAYQFTSQEKDLGTGLYYYRSRYYDPELRSFIQADMILDTHLISPPSSLAFDLLLPLTSDPLLPLFFFHHVPISP